MAKLRVLSRNGDDEYGFSAEDGAATKAAKEIFRKNMDAGYAAFALDGEGIASKIRDFDAKADEIVMFRQLVGG